MNSVCLFQSMKVFVYLQKNLKWHPQNEGMSVAEVHIIDAIAEAELHLQFPDSWQQGKKHADEHMLQAIMFNLL